MTVFLKYSLAGIDKGSEKKVIFFRGFCSFPKNCVVCHSDLHIERNERHGTVYPCVLGHEIVGKVVRVSEQVTRFQVGELGFYR